MEEKSLFVSVEGLEPYYPPYPAPAYAEPLSHVLMMVDKHNKTRNQSPLVHNPMEQ